MPLRDHFKTKSTLLNWNALHGYWPATIVAQLNSRLPDEYVAQPRVYPRGENSLEIDVGTLEREAPNWSPERDREGGGLAVAAWAPPAPAVLLDIDLPPSSEYEINVYTQDEYRLVAAIELVSPSNKDRPENRKTFVNKCESLLKKGVCVTIVDVVTDRTTNLYGELLAELGATETAVSKSGLYAVTCRGRRLGPRWRLESWECALAVGNALPTLPICLSPDRAVPLDLEAAYEEACRSLRIR